jgi:hypothetical protein
LRTVAFAEYEISLLFLGQFVPVRGKGYDRHEELLTRAHSLDRETLLVMRQAIAEAQALSSFDAGLPAAMILKNVRAQSIQTTWADFTT